MPHAFLGDLLMLLVTIDPIGTLSVFVGVTGAAEAAQRRWIAVKAVLVGGLVLLGFLVGGQFLLAGIGVRLVSFSLAGGVILFLVAVQMVFGSGPAVDPPKPEQGHDVAVFPLALPSIASPGSIMAVMVLTDNNKFAWSEQALTGAALVVVLLATLGCLLLANRIHRAIGTTGAAVAIRVMGLILAALAAEQIVAGVTEIIREIGHV